MIAQIDLSTDTVLGWSNNYTVDNIQFFETGINEPWLYDYITSTPGVFDPNGFVMKQPDVIDLPRDEKIALMNAYMQSLVDSGDLTQSGLDAFLEDTFVASQTFISGSNRLVTWVETTSRDGYNATLTGFKTHAEYRGASEGGLAGIGAIYPRAEHILSILNS